MSTQPPISASQLWIRMAIFLGASMALNFMLSAPLFFVADGIGGFLSPPVAASLLTVASMVPELLAAVLAWGFLPRSFFPGRGPRRAWIWCLILLVLGVLARFAAPGLRLEILGDAAGSADPLPTLLAAALFALPEAAMLALIQMTFLFDVARRAMPAPAAGALVAGVVAVPGLVGALYLALGGAGDSNPPLGTALALIAFRALLWAVLLSGLGFLVDGRPDGQRWLLSTLVLLPAVAYSSAGSLYGSLPAGSGAGELLTDVLRANWLVLALGVAAWILALVSAPRGANARGTRPGL